MQRFDHGILSAGTELSGDIASVVFAIDLVAVTVDL